MSKNKIISAASQQDLAGIKERRLLIGGQLVFAAMQAGNTPPKGYVAQMPREAVSGLLAGFKKNNPKVHVHVHPSALELPKTRFAFAIDAYLTWGAKQRSGTVALFGGIERNDGGFHVDVLVFDEGRLVELYDQELPERGSSRFGAAAESIVSQLRAKFPGVRVLQAAPLSDWGLTGVEYVGERPLKHLSFKPLSRSLNDRGHLALPAAIVLAGVLFNIGAVGMAWTNYRNAVSRYDAAAADPEIAKQGGIDSNYINVMTQRRVFMEAPRRQDLLPAKILSIVRGIGVLPSVQIVEMKLPAPSIGAQPSSGVVVNPEGSKDKDLITPERVPDTWMRISVPKSNGSALDQAHDVLSTLARSTGMTLRLVQRGWQDDGARRIFTIEGFIHG